MSYISLAPSNRLAISRGWEQGHFPYYKREYVGSFVFWYKMYCFIKILLKRMKMELLNLELKTTNNGILTMYLNILYSYKRGLSVKKLYRKTPLESRYNRHILRLVGFPTFWKFFRWFILSKNINKKIYGSAYPLAKGLTLTSKDTLNLVMRIFMAKTHNLKFFKNTNHLTIFSRHAQWLGQTFGRKQQIYNFYRLLKFYKKKRSCKKKKRVIFLYKFKKILKLDRKRAKQDSKICKNNVIKKKILQHRIFARNNFNAKLYYSKLFLKHWRRRYKLAISRKIRVLYHYRNKLIKRKLKKVKENKILNFVCSLQSLKLRKTFKNKFHTLKKYLLRTKKILKIDLFFFYHQRSILNALKIFKKYKIKKPFKTYFLLWVLNKKYSKLPRIWTRLHFYKQSNKIFFKKKTQEIKLNQIKKKRNHFFNLWKKKKISFMNYYKYLVVPSYWNNYNLPKLKHKKFNKKKYLDLMIKKKKQKTKNKKKKLKKFPFKPYKYEKKLNWHYKNNLMLIRWPTYIWFLKYELILSRILFKIFRITYLIKFTQNLHKLIGIKRLVRKIERSYYFNYQKYRNFQFYKYVIRPFCSLYRYGNIDKVTSQIRFYLERIKRKHTYPIKAFTALFRILKPARFLFFKLQIAGKINYKTRSRVYIASQGGIPLNRFNTQMSYSQAIANAKAGSFMIRLTTYNITTQDI